MYCLFSDPRKPVCNEITNLLGRRCLPPIAVIVITLVVFPLPIHSIHKDLATDPEITTQDMK